MFVSCECVCVLLSVIRCNSNLLHIQCVGKKVRLRKEGREKERKKERTMLHGLCGGNDDDIRITSLTLLKNGLMTTCVM